jgi:hypothetical protein
VGSFGSFDRALSRLRGKRPVLSKPARMHREKSFSRSFTRRPGKLCNRKSLFYILPEINRNYTTGYRYLQYYL